MTICCIGSGNMGTALMKGAASAAGSVDIGFTDIDSAKAKAAAASLKVKILSSNSKAVEEGDYVFLAVKPQILKEVLEEIAPAVKKRLANVTLVSMAPGWSIEKIQNILQVKAPVIRIMPNTPSLISRGVIVMSPSRKCLRKK